MIPANSSASGSEELGAISYRNRDHKQKNTSPESANLPPKDHPRSPSKPLGFLPPLV